MSQLALYRSWRPQNFDEVVAQRQVVFPLKQAIISGDIGHAYLFSGTRGTGKTSLAKIFAKAANCLAPEKGNPCNQCEICQGINNATLLDVMEIDAASHNSVDNIRRITDEVLFMPTRARYKVYIIDEVHMLSQGAFNALLKTLEEPPEHAIFILATTEPQRIPPTILSRCQRFEFRRIPLEDILDRLKEISYADKIDIDEEALFTIARLGDGALRDAISLLDQCQSGIQGKISHDDVLNIAGLVKDEFLARFAGHIFRGDLHQTLVDIDEIQMSGRDIQRFLQDFLRFLRDILVVQISPKAEHLLEYSENDIKELRTLAKLAENIDLIAVIKRLSKLNNDMRWSSDPKTSLELALIAEISRIGQIDFVERTEPAVEPKAKSKPAAVKEAYFEGEPAAEVLAEPEDETPIAADVQPHKEDKSPVKAKPERRTESKEKAETGRTAETVEKFGAQIEEIEKSSLPKEESGMPEAALAVEAAEAVAKETPAEKTEKEISFSHNKEVWEKVLDKLKDKSRYDLVMLIRPAKVYLTGQELHIHYAEAQRAHGKALSRPDNVDVLRSALLESGVKNPDIRFSFEGEKPEVKEAENLNPDEPLWVRKLREASSAHDLELQITKLEEEAESGRPFYDFSLPDDDRLPY